MGLFSKMTFTTSFLAGFGFAWILPSPIFERYSDRFNVKVIESDIHYTPEVFNTLSKKIHQQTSRKVASKALERIEQKDSDDEEWMEFKEMYMKVLDEYDETEEIWMTTQKESRSSRELDKEWAKYEAAKNILGKN